HRRTRRPAGGGGVHGLPGVAVRRGVVVAPGRTGSVSHGARGSAQRTGLPVVPAERVAAARQRSAGRTSEHGSAGRAHLRLLGRRRLQQQQRSPEPGRHPRPHGRRRLPTRTRRRGRRQRGTEHALQGHLQHG
ncbi:MAG: hypothetical protein ACK53Y_00385, partial [bacterium]